SRPPKSDGPASGDRVAFPPGDNERRTGIAGPRSAHRLHPLVSHSAQRFESFFGWPRVIDAFGHRWSGSASLRSRTAEAPAVSAADRAGPLLAAFLREMRWTTWRRSR